MRGVASGAAAVTGISEDCTERREGARGRGMPARRPDLMRPPPAAPAPPIPSSVGLRGCKMGALGAPPPGFSPLLVSAAPPP
eukprot:CAMPEP_0202348874 /NCGR_PEP_ID=MMETSP1126-20121109/6602_1 /ASSEMBLY_ACC=CAM_ASM_000457 /TAXON_ID=3047 /ORGANISM="Dunaliella tertiolecta, Strain CCMP1320" /LENGTH=81 /DNA_ID=CAMNT_0048940593 /DNA_START=2137 /DNA_END=2378 /DNA_ORIENTATION=-